MRPVLSLILLAALLAACAPAAADTATPTPAPATATPPPPPTATLAPPTPTAFVPVIGAPAPATLTIGAQTQVSGIGSYCWNTSGDPAQGIGVCVDKMGIITPLDALPAPAGPLTASFDLPLDETPSTLSLHVFPADSQPSVFGEVQGWMPNFETGQQFDLPLAADPAIELDLEPGVYVLGLFVRWERWGDVFYGYLVEVGAP